MFSEQGSDKGVKLQKYFFYTTVMRIRFLEKKRFKVHLNNENEIYFTSE